MKKLRKLARFLSGRVVITAILLVLQIYWFALMLVRLSEYSFWISMGLEVLSLGIVLFLTSKEDNPSYRIAWITLVMLVPLFGGIMYLLFGNKRSSKRMRIQIDSEHTRLAQYNVQDMSVMDRLSKADPRAASRSHYMLDIGHYPLRQNSETVYYSVGEDMFRDMMEALESAEHFIFMEYFIIKDGVMWRAVLDVLMRKVKEGVDVRFIYDDVGSLFLLPYNFASRMEAFGIKCLRFNPFVPLLSLVMNNRDHRKILVVDGHTAFNGGINLSDEYINEDDRLGHWKDTGVRIRGDAAWSFTLMFLEIWYAFRPSDEDINKFRPHIYHEDEFATDGYVQPFGDSPLDDEPFSATVYTDLLAQATRYVYIFTPYLVPDDQLRQALVNCAKRGVDVRIVTPGIPDKKLVYRLTRSNYLPLIQAGVRIYEYTPGFMHAKSYLCDDKYGVVGTINMDFRSLFLHFECGTYMYGAKCLNALKRDYLDVFGESCEIAPEDCRRGFWGSLFDTILRAFSPLL